MLKSVPETSKSHGFANIITSGISESDFFVSGLLPIDSPEQASTPRYPVCCLTPRTPTYICVWTALGGYRIGVPDHRIPLEVSGTNPWFFQHQRKTCLYTTSTEIIFKDKLIFWVALKLCSIPVVVSVFDHNSSAATTTAARPTLTSAGHATQRGTGF